MLITVVSILVTGVLLIRQLRRATKRIRLRPRLDLLRIVVQLGAVIVVAALLGAGAPIAALVLVGLFAVGPGYVQGRNLEISDDDGKLYAVRNTVAVAVWGVGLVIMQFAGLLRRTGILSVGQATAWVGVGLAIGLMIGRNGPLSEYRRTAARIAAPVAAVVVGLLTVASFAGGRQADAQDTGQWVRVDEQVNPGGEPAPETWQVTLTATSMTVVESFGPDYPDGGEATFEASWEAPPETLVPGDPLAIPVTVSGRNTGNLDTQYFFGLDVIMIVDGTWNSEAVGAGANCAQTTVISGVYICSDPVTNSGEMTTRVPTSGDEFSVGVGALNCGGACYVGWSYRFEQAGASGDAAVAGDTDTGTEIGSDVGGDPGADGVTGRDGATSSDTGQLDDFVEQQSEESGIEPDEAMRAAIAGVIAALATGGISLIEAMDGVAQIFEEGSTIERRPRQPDPVDPANPDGPGEDGMYDWGGRRVSPEDYADLLADEAAIEADRQARIDALISLMESEEQAAARFGDLAGRSADDDRRARDALAEELETLRNRTRTRERVADILAERARAGGWDSIAERITRGDELTREELISIRTALDRLSRRQGTVDHDATGSFSTDLLDEFAKDAATAQEVIAQIAEHSPGGPLAGWVVRNPTAAGRIAAALGTGGLSEGIIAPWEIAAAMERAAAQAHAEGRDLTYGEAIAAGMWQVGPGMLIGKLGQVGIDRYGRAIAEATGEALEAASRQLDNFLEAGARAGAREGLETGLREGAESVAARAATRIANAPRLSPQELSELRTQVAAAVKSGDDEALRAIYQNGGMGRLGQLEAAGAMDQQTAKALVDFHDRVTGNAIRQGTHDTIDEFARLNGGIRPKEVLVGNSGSVGAGRSVVTDADRTISTTFSDTDIDRWIIGKGGGMTRSEAARQMRADFARLHEGNVVNNLNPPGTLNPVAKADMDVSSYGGFAGGSSHGDIYPTGYTQSRTAIQGGTDVYRVDPQTGQATVHSTSGQAIIDHNMLEEVRFTGKEIPRVDGWPLDPARIPDTELGPLLREQQKAIAKYTDVKSIAKALDRAEYIAARSRQPMGNQKLVDAAVRIRTDPRQTAAVLKELNMTEAQFVAASREMMEQYAPVLPS